MRASSLSHGDRAQAALPTTSARTRRPSGAGRRRLYMPFTSCELLKKRNSTNVWTQRRTSDFGCAAQLLQEADSGPFAAPGAEAPVFSPRRAASCRLQISSADCSLVAATGMPHGAARTRGLAAAYATNVVQTRLDTRPGVCNLHYDARRPLVARPSSPSRAANYFGSDAAAVWSRPPPLVHAVHVLRASREAE